MTAIVASIVIFLGTLSAVVSMDSAMAGPPIPRDQFRTQFETRMLEGFCSETKFVSHCYDVSKEACRDQVRNSIRKCLKSADLSKEIKEEDRAKVGTEIGRCIGEDFQARNKSRLRKIPECQNAIEWLGK